MIKREETKRILCLIDSLGPGGAQRQFVGMACLLKNEGYEVKVLTYHNIPFFEPLLNEEGVGYQNVEGGGNKKTRLIHLRKAIKSYAPDTVISFLDTPNILACIIRLTGVKYKLIVSERNYSIKQTWLTKIKFKYIYRLANFVVSNSHTQHEFIIANYPHLKNKARVITNFVDIDKFTPEINNDVCDKDHLLKVVCVGRVSPQKNVLCFLDAVKLLKDKKISIRISWYGKPDKGYFEKCEKKIKEYSIEDMILFYPPEKNISEIYRHSDLFCLPSSYEGFPNVLCEAMSCGLPVLCSNVCDNPIIVKEGVNGYLFDPTNPESIVSCFERFMKTDKVVVSGWRINNREKAEKLFTKRCFIDKYMEII